MILPPSVLARSRHLPGGAGLTVTHTGRFDRVQGHHVQRPQGTPEYILILCLAGSGHGQCDGRRWTLRAGEGVLLPPQRPHTYTASARSPWTLLWFHFTGAWAPDLARQLGGEGPCSHFSVDRIETLIEAFEECQTYVVGGYTDGELIGLNTSFIRFLGLCRARQRHSDQRGRPTEDRVLKTIRYMRENLTGTVSLAQLAHQAGLSVPHYSALFKRVTHCSPVEYLIRLRLQNACERLVHTDAPIAEIARAVGFEDPLYFSRVFRRYLGTTASSYRHQGERHRASP